MKIVKPNQMYGSVYARLVAFHLYSIYLFTFSDLKTIIWPTSVFGMLNSLAASVFELPSIPIMVGVFHRALFVGLWVWINLLPFLIDNHRQLASVGENFLNKPRRPMPTKKISSKTSQVFDVDAVPGRC